jgi:hypothetical protein
MLVWLPRLLFLAVAQSCFPAARTAVQLLLSMSAALVLSGTSQVLSQQDWCTLPAWPSSVLQFGVVCHIGRWLRCLASIIGA